jgi:transposase-like protein
MPPEVPEAYPPKSQREAVRLVRATGRWVREVSAELGVSSESLPLWLKQDQLDRGERATTASRATSATSCAGCAARYASSSRSARS